MKAAIIGSLNLEGYFGSSSFNFDPWNFSESVMPHIRQGFGDSNSMAFLPFFFFLAVYSFLKEKRILHFFSLFMIITLHSNFVYIVGILLFYELIFLHFGEGKKIKIWLSKKHNPRGRPRSSIDYLPPREFGRKFLNELTFRERFEKKEVEVKLDEN